MSWINENKIRIIILYINLIFIMVVMKLCYKIQHFDFFLVSIVFVAAVLIYYFYSKIIKKNSHRLLITSILIFSITFFIYKNLTEVFQFINEKYIDNFNGINELLYRGASTEFEYFKPFILVFLPLIVVLLLILYNKKATEAVLLLDLSILLLFWYLEYVTEVKSILFIFVALSVLTYATNNNMKYLKKIQKLGVKNNLNFKSNLACIVIFSMLVAFLGFLFPQNIEGNFSEESFTRWTNPFSPDPRDTIEKAKEGRYGLSSSGYNNTETHLGGPLQLNNVLVFQVKSEKPLYLRGNVKEVYTGRSWIKSEENYISKSDITDRESSKFLKENLVRGSETNTTTITIIPQKIITNTMFVPYYTDKVNSSRGNVYFETEGETFINSSKISKEYTVEFYDPILVSDYIKRTYMYRDIIVSFNESQKYLDVPTNVSQRTKDLVRNIVKNLRTNKEKVDAIQAYLTTNYPYSLEVSEVPENQEFLDYFLFTEKKGYCTYFATAMTIMCRMAGIPARYVEGYKMSETSVNGYYDVTNEEAHAWTEVLYRSSPQLWVVKDPSPTPLEERSRIEQETTGSAIDKIEEEQSDEPVDEVVNENETTEENMENGDPSIAESINYKYIILIFIILILLGYIITRHIILINKIKFILNHKSNIPFYNYSIIRLKKIGIIKKINETDKDFVLHIKEEDFRNDMCRLVDAVYEEFYGGITSSSIDKNKIYNELEVYIKNRENRFLYLIKKYYI